MRLVWLQVRSPRNNQGCRISDILVALPQRPLVRSRRAIFISAVGVVKTVSIRRRPQDSRDRAAIAACCWRSQFHGRSSWRRLTGWPAIRARSATPSTSASSKNFLLAWAKHDASRIGPGCRVENSHLPVRRRERAMLRFQRMKSLQKFASVHASLHKHFNSERHLVDRKTYKERRSAAWSERKNLAA